jgi:hypothetical protein
MIERLDSIAPWPPNASDRRRDLRVGTPTFSTGDQAILLVASLPVTEPSRHRQYNKST